MVRKVLYPAVFVIVALVATQAFAGWSFIGVDTALWGEGLDFPLLMPDGVTLVPVGAHVQFIMDTAGDGLDDPIAYFGGDQVAITAWINAGCAPLDDDVLLHSPTWNGTTALIADGNVTEYPGFPGYDIDTPGQEAGMTFGWRAWNLSLEGLETFCTRPLEEVWYTDGTEKGSYDGVYAGWTIDSLSLWSFTGTIGYEAYLYATTGDPEYRSANILDKKLATCGEPIIPEPGTMLLIGSSALLLFLRRKK